MRPEKRQQVLFAHASQQTLTVEEEQDRKYLAKSA